MWAGLGWDNGLNVSTMWLEETKKANEINDRPMQTHCKRIAAALPILAKDG
jgi:hypothetical protein